jgi:hypothetical protein
MPDMTEQEADAFDELLTNTTPSVNPDEKGLFARNREMAVVLDGFSTRYIESKMLITKLSPAEIISEMIRKEIRNAVAI